MPKNLSAFISSLIRITSQCIRNDFPAGHYGINNPDSLIAEPICRATTSQHKEMHPLVSGVCVVLVTRVATEHKTGAESQGVGSHNRSSASRIATEDQLSLRCVLLCVFVPSRRTI